MNALIKFRNIFLPAIAAAVIIQSAGAQESNWTHFRGSHLNGISDVTTAPVHWNDSTNILWKTDIAGKGWSSPVVFGDQVWVTTATREGKDMSGICLDLNTGKIIYEIKLFQPDHCKSKRQGPADFQRISSLHCL